MASEVTPIKNSKFKPKWETVLFWVEIGMGILFLTSSILFCVHQPWLEWNKTIDVYKWGTYGDFIGGFLGTICAYISIRLLVKNLKEQEKSNSYIKNSNDRSSEVFELQLVHQNVSTLQESYKHVVDSFEMIDTDVDSRGKIHGKSALKRVANNIYNAKDENNEDSIESRIDIARGLFDKEYIKFRDSMSVYYRLLYQMFQIIWLSDIKGHKKAMLSKMLRSQFSEDELLLLRYNCLTPNGEKMRFYVNQFNLLKHLPLSHLREFKKWVFDLNEVQCNRLDTECVILKKQIKNLLILCDVQNEAEYEFTYSEKYQSVIKITESKKSCYFEIIRKNNVGSSQDETSMDKVLDKWDDKKMRDFFVDYFKYVFDFSSFSLFNKMSDLTIYSDIKTEDDGNKHTVCVSIKKKSSLLVSMPQDEDPKK